MFSPDPSQLFFKRKLVYIAINIFLLFSLLVYGGDVNSERSRQVSHQLSVPYYDASGMHPLGSISLTTTTTTETTKGTQTTVSIIATTLSTPQTVAI